MSSPPPPPLPAPAAPANPRLAVLLSACVFPGVGQCVQRRWWVGVGFALVFGLALGGMLWELARIFRALIALLSFETTAPTPPGWRRLGVAFALTFGVYALSLADTLYAARRRPRHNG